MIYEIRNYHYAPERLAEYRAWANDVALPYIRSHMDLVGFWVKTDEPVEVSGKPQDELGAATVTWIIRWDSMAARNAGMREAFGGEAWRRIMDQNPGRENYLRTEAKFADAL